MIDEIRARNVALISDATLIPSKGLTVLTGETGAGKTALLSACKLLCGERADVTTIREGTTELIVEGRFFTHDEEEVVSRKLGDDGRSRVSINGEMASVKELQARIGPFVDLCGQHEHQKLLKTSTHVEMLDAWAEDSISSALEAYRDALKASELSHQELLHVQEASQASSERLEEARFVLERINSVNPIAGEYEKLSASLSKAEHAESLAQASGSAHELLSGDGGAIDAIQNASMTLDALTDVDAKLGEFASSLREAGFVLEDISRETRAYRDSIDFDPETLSAGQERIAAMQGLMRSYGPRMEDVIAKRDEAAELISLVDESADRLEKAQRKLDEAESELVKKAEALDKARTKAAPQFAEAVNKELAKLEMGGARIVCQIEMLERNRWTQQGPSRVEFLFQPAETMQARPLVRIASGGEISRVMLAIKVVLGAADEVETLIFDEVDAGVGGSAALALANVLAELAKTHQVLVVTHLAQIAVFGTTHYQVVKKDDGADGIPETLLLELTEEERVSEVARMLSGEISEASLKHAEEMLTKARK